MPQMTTWLTRFTAAALLAAGVSCGSTDVELAPRDFARNPEQGPTEAAGDANHDRSPGPNTTSAANSTNLSPTAGDTDNNDAGQTNPPIPTGLQQTIDKLPRPHVTSAISAADEGAFTVNAMIGQVNGRPLYASQVLEPLEAQLIAMAAQFRGSRYKQAATNVIFGRLRQIVFDSLFLGEAERNLTDQQRFSLDIMMRLNREELVRKHGGGSETLAEESLQKKTGRSLSETLESIRQTILIRRYQEEHIFPKISVSRREIEKFYRDHFDERYRGRDERELRLIRVSDEDDAEEIQALLDDPDVRFEDAARATANKYRRLQGGKMGELAEGAKPFGFDELNAALAKLKEGQRSDRIEVEAAGQTSYWWVYVEKMHSSDAKPLRDVQLAIEREIKSLRYQMLLDTISQRMFDDAGYGADPRTTANPLLDMTAALVEIAVNRYATP